LNPARLHLESRLPGWSISLRSRVLALPGPTARLFRTYEPDERGRHRRLMTLGLTKQFSKESQNAPTQPWFDVAPTAATTPPEFRSQCDVLSAWI
jgi:hypothetical protein